jgi:hypothetical protein
MRKIIYQILIFTSLGYFFSLAPPKSQAKDRNKPEIIQRVETYRSHSIFL